MSQGSLSPGTNLNESYRITKFIGEGGTGEVYLAENIWVSGHQVAIKVLKPQFSHNPAYISLLERELLQNVKHDAVVSYLGLYQSAEQGGAYFLVMEYIDGPHLARLMANGPVPADMLIAIGRRVAAGLKAAHALGVYHRDISPDNIILRGNDPDRATLIDFGIAKDERPNAGTVVGHGFAGKYEYASPEQIDGRPIDGRSDIYSLGATLLAAARGEAPRMPVGRKEIEKLKEQPLDVSGIDKPLASLITRMTAPDPVDRFRDAAELLRAFDGEDVLVSPPPVRRGDGLVLDLDEPEVYGTEKRERRGFAWLGWVVAVGVLVGAIVLALQLGWIDKILGPNLPLADPYRFKAEFGAPPTIDGHAPAEEAKAALEQAVADISGGQAPVSALTLAEGMPFETWPDAVSGLVRATEPLDQWQIDVIGNRAVVKGLADSQGEHDAVVRALNEAARKGPLELDTRIQILVAALPVATLSRALAENDVCGGLDVGDGADPIPPNGRITITGRAPDRERVRKLEEALRGLADGREIDTSGVEILNPFVCRVLDQLALRETSDVRITYGFAATGQTNNTNDFLPTDVPLIDVEIPRQIGGYLSVFIADNEGAIIHRIPRQGHETQLLDDLGTVSGSRRIVRVAHARKDPTCPDGTCALNLGNGPFGTNYVFALITDRPLFTTLRPGLENVEAFAPALADALGRAADRGALRSVALRRLRVEDR